MKKNLGCFLASFLFGVAHAGYADGILINRVYIDSNGQAFFGGVSSTLPAGVCSYFGEWFQLDTRTAQGKNLLNIVLTAKATQNPNVMVWYTDSTAPGTRETNGCTYTSIAKVTAVGVR